MPGNQEKQWRIYQPPPVANSTININGGEVPFETKYLDLRGVPRNAYERTIKIDYGTSAEALSSETEKYTFIIGIAGLGGAEYQEVGVREFVPKPFRVNTHDLDKCASIQDKCSKNWGNCFFACFQEFIPFRL